MECTNDKEAIEAAKAGADIIMLDNYSPASIKIVITKLKEIKKDLLVEASGNITDITLLDYAKSSVDIVSLGALTHSSKVFDMSMIFNND